MRTAVPVERLAAATCLCADAGASGRQALGTALFARIEVLGYRQMAYELTGDATALGLDVVLPAVLELNGPIAEFGRGEGRCPAITDLLVMRLAERPEPFDWLRTAWRAGPPDEHRAHRPPELTVPRR